MQNTREECPIAPWMKANGYKQDQVADLLGVPQSSISAYITGRRGFRWQTLLALSGLTGVAITDLVAWRTKHQKKRVTKKKAVKQ